LIILGLLILIKSLEAFFLAGSPDGGCILVSYQKFSPLNSLKLVIPSRLISRLMIMVLNFLPFYTLLENSRFLEF
jgi:hypothetical protein